MAKPDIRRLLIDTALAPEVCRRLAEAPDAVFEHYDLSEEERELLRHPDHRLLPLLGAVIQRAEEAEAPPVEAVSVAPECRVLPDAQMALTVVPCRIGERVSYAAWISPLQEGGDPSRLPPPPGASLPGTPLAPLYAVIQLTASESNDGTVRMWASFRQSSNAVTAPPPGFGDAPHEQACRPEVEAVKSAAPEERYDKLLALVRALRGDSGR